MLCRKTAIYTSPVGFDRFALDRLAVDGLEPVGAELNRLLGVLDRLATLFRCRG